MSHLAPPAPPTSQAAGPRRAGKRRVVLVCKACEKRSKGPKKLTGKALSRHLRRAGREAPVPRLRVVLTGCLGACPKKAITVGAASADGEIAMIAFRRGDDPAAAIAALFPTTDAV